MRLIKSEFRGLKMEAFKIENYFIPVPRKLMGKDEIKWAEGMVKLGLMVKGFSTEKNGGVIYYAEKMDERD
jgi:hypothetical protein